MLVSYFFLQLLGKRLSHSDPDFQKVLEINKLFNQLFSPGESLELDCRPWTRLHNEGSDERLKSALRLRDQFFQEQIVPLQVSVFEIVRFHFYFTPSFGVYFV